jgi:CP family cyanate transporter-like MFS transporter
MSTRAKLGALSALFIAAAALRPQVIGIGPLLPEIQHDLDVSHAVAGLLVTIPVACMGLFAPPGPMLAARLGSRHALAACLAVIAAFGILRTLVPGAAGVILLTLPVGIGMGLAGPLLAVAVKERFASRPAFATGVYSTGLIVGSSGAALFAPMIADASGSWRGSLFVFSLVGAAAVAGWLLLTRGPAGRAVVAGTLPRLPWRRPIVWGLALAFAGQGLSFYGITAWLPDIYVERGWSEDDAAGLIALLILVGLPTGLLLPIAADRFGSRRAYLVPSAAVLVVATVGVALVPGGAWLWAFLMGASLGAVFPLLLTLPLDVCDDPRDVGAAAALMLGAGYTLSAVSPFVMGALRDLTGSYESSVWALTVFAAIMLAAVLPLTTTRLRPRAPSS